METRQYTTADENGTTTYTVELPSKGIVKVSRPFANSAFYEVFTYDETGMFASLTVDYKHGNGEGTVRIPASVFYEMPVFAAILQHVQGGTTFGKTEIFASVPITTLFEDSKY